MDSDVLIIGRAAPPANIMGGVRRGELRRISLPELLYKP